MTSKWDQIWLQHECDINFIYNKSLSHMRPVKQIASKTNPIYLWNCKLYVISGNITFKTDYIVYD